MPWRPLKVSQKWLKKQKGENNMFKKALLLTLTLTPLISYAACNLNDIEIKDAYITGGLSDQKNTAGYAHIYNKGTEPCHLKAASSSIAKRIELHTIEHKGNMMKMVQVDQFTIPAKGELTLKNGDNHLMFLDLEPKKLTPGETVKVELVFDQDQKKTQEFTVQDMKK